MISFVTQHPYYTILIGWLLLTVVAVIIVSMTGPHWKKNKFETGGIYGGNKDMVREGDPYTEQDHYDGLVPGLFRQYHSGGVIPAGTAVPVLIERQPNEHRIPMRNRFTSDDGEPVMRSLLMADQIVHDQQIAHEEPGEEATAPAPGEPGYVDSSINAQVSVGPYTVYMNSGDRPMFVTEAMVDPGETRTRFVDPENVDLVATLTLEVLRLREGWTVA